MESEKRKRVADGEGANGKRGKGEDEDNAHDGVKGVALTPPGDEEVEEFFAILRRMQVALKYFQNRNVDREGTSTAAPWKPSFRREDFDGVDEQTPEKTDGNQYAGLDLNSDPVSGASDSV